MNILYKLGLKKTPYQKVEERVRRSNWEFETMYYKYNAGAKTIYLYENHLVYKYNEDKDQENFVYHYEDLICAKWERYHTIITNRKGRQTFVLKFKRKDYISSKEISIYKSEKELEPFLKALATRIYEYKDKMVKEIMKDEE